MNKNKWFLNGGRGSGRTIKLLCDTYENKIADLEKELDYQKQARSIAENAVVDLTKENAELKNFIMQSKKDGISPINALIIKNLGNQLTKAKEIIRDLLNLPFANNEEVFADVGSHLYKAEQFLKE